MCIICWPVVLSELDVVYMSADQMSSVIFNILSGFPYMYVSVFRDLLRLRHPMQKCMPNPTAFFLEIPESIRDKGFSDFTKMH